MKRQRSVSKLIDDVSYEELKISKRKSKKIVQKDNLKIKFEKKTQNVTKKEVSKKEMKKEDSKSKKRSKSSFNLKYEKLELDDCEIDKLEEKKNQKGVVLKLNSLNLNTNMGPIRIRLGLCCLNNYLRAKKDSVFCSRSCTLSTYRSKGKQEAQERGMKNVKDVEKLLLWNQDHYIEVHRISSELFPHYSNIRNIEDKDRYSLNLFKKELKVVGDLAKKLNHRLTFHPGQFNVVGSPNETVFKSTCEDLKMHADILDLMGLDDNSIMVVHGGGTYGDKKETIKRWVANFKRLPENVKRRLVLENDEKNFSIVDCLEVNKEIGIPIVFDNHHFECYKLYHLDEKFDDIRSYILAAIESWTKKGLRPKFHISEQNKDKTFVGAHSDYIKTFPDYYLEIPKIYKVGVDIMVEAKAKEAAILDLYQRYKEEFLSHIENVDESRLQIDKENKMARECPKCI